MSLIVNIRNNPLINNDLDSLCITCNKKLHKTELVSMHQLLPLVKPSISFYEALKLISNFGQFSIDQVPQNACHACFKNADGCLRFQTFCHQAVDNIKAYILHQENTHSKILKQSPSSSVDQDLLADESQDIPIPMDSLEVIVNDCNDLNDKETDEPKGQGIKFDQDRQSEDEGSESRIESDKDDDDFFSNEISDKKAREMERRKRKTAWRKEKVACKYCQKPTRRDQINAHERNHRGELPYVCTICDKGFSGSWNLRNHVKMHSDTLDYLCSECGKGFKSSVLLGNHKIRKHKEDTPKTCEICGKVSRNGISHRNHMKTHGERKFECDQCDKKFYKSSGLKAHSTLHTGIKPFDCTFCGTRFTKKKSMQKHVAHHCKVLKSGTQINTDISLS